MKNKRANLVVNIICALLICVFGGVSVYATVTAINYTHTASSSIGFTANSVKGEVYASISGTENDATFNNAYSNSNTNNIWKFDAYTDSSHALESKQYTMASSVMTGTQVVITINISNTTPNGKMAVNIDNLQKAGFAVVVQNAANDGNATGVSIDTNGDGTCTTINANSSSVITITITVPNATPSINGTISFHLDLSRTST